MEMVDLKKSLSMQKGSGTWIYLMREQIASSLKLNSELFVNFRDHLFSFDNWR